MSNKLESFADIIKRGVAEKQLREEAELSRKLKENTPLLSELFATVAKAKQKPEPVEEVVEVHVVPEAARMTLDEVQTTETADTIKSLQGVLKRLQNDFVMLSRQVTEVANRPVSSGYGGGGSGEVRILRMDDVVRQTPNDHDLMVWDSSINKFVFQPPTELLTVTKNVIATETVIPVDTSYQVINYLNLKSTLILHGNLKIT